MAPCGHSCEGQAGSAAWRGEAMTIGLRVTIGLRGGRGAGISDPTPSCRVLPWPCRPGLGRPCQHVADLALVRQGLLLVVHLQEKGERPSVSSRMYTQQTCVFEPNTDQIYQHPQDFVGGVQLLHLPAVPI